MTQGVFSRFCTTPMCYSAPICHDIFFRLLKSLQICHSLILSLSTLGGQERGTSGFGKMHRWWYSTFTYILRLCGERFLVGFQSRSFMFSNELSIGSVVSLAAVLYWSQLAKGGIAGSGLYKSGVLLRLWTRVSRQRREKRSCAQLLNIATTDLRWPSNVKIWSSKPFAVFSRSASPLRIARQESPPIARQLCLWFDRIMWRKSITNSWCEEVSVHESFRLCDMWGCHTSGSELENFNISDRTGLCKFASSFDGWFWESQDINHSDWLGRTGHLSCGSWMTTVCDDCCIS
jgi:hypothetical protein